MRRYLLFGTERYALGILRPLQRAIRARGDEAAWYFHGRAAEGLEADERRLDSVAAVRSFDPRAVFVPGNWVPDFFPGIKVEVFHGFNVQKRSRRKGHFRIRGFFDLYCTQGPDTTEPFEALAGRLGYFRVVETGWPKMDPLFAPVGKERRGDSRRPVVLYTSTFSETLSSTRALFDTIRGLVAQGTWDWIVTFHPKMRRDVVERYRGLEGPSFRLVESDDVVPLLRAADVMLSDTSSIVSEFLLLHKPVVTFRNRAPGPWLVDVRRSGDLAAALERALERPPELIDAVRGYADRIHPYRDGRSSDRVLAAAEQFIEQGRAGLRPKPLNFWRRVQARREIGFYGWR